jgi:hypothetical protein
MRPTRDYRGLGEERVKVQCTCLTLSIYLSFDSYYYHGSPTARSGYDYCYCRCSRAARWRLSRCASTDRQLSCASNGLLSLSVAQAVAEQCPFSYYGLILLHDLEPSSLARTAAAPALCDVDYRGVHHRIDNCLALLMVYSACP